MVAAPQTPPQLAMLAQLAPQAPAVLASLHQRALPAELLQPPWPCAPSLPLGPVQLQTLWGEVSDPEAPMVVALGAPGLLQ